VALHALAAVLAWRVLRRLRVPGAWLAAALFAVHPVHVESVAWVAERKNVLSGALALAAALLWLRWADAPAGRAGRDWAAALACFVGALLAKTVTCTVPVVLLLARWWQRGRLERRELVGMAPLVVLGVAIAPVTVWMERTHVGARGALWDLSLAQRTCIAGRALWHQLASLAWPQRLAFVYPRWPVDPGTATAWAFPAAAVLAAGALWLLRGRLGLGPLLAAAIFAITLGPSLGFVNVYPMRYTFVADHYQYLASLAPLALVGALVARGGRPAEVTAGVAVAVLMLVAHARGAAFRDAETLWRDTLATHPDVAMARINLGMLLHGAGRHEEAAREFEAALALEPGDPDALNDLALALVAQGKTAEAIARWEEAVRVAPGHAEAWNNLGNALAQEGRLADARVRYEAALRVRPGYPDARSNLGNVLLMSGDVDGARAQFAEAVRLDPVYAAARRGLGVALAASGRLPEALESLQVAVRLAPRDGEIRAALGDVLSASDRPADAAAAYDQALRLGVVRPALLNGLGVALARAGRSADARAAFARALELDPDDADARRNLDALR